MNKPHPLADGKKFKMEEILKEFLPKLQQEGFSFLMRVHHDYGVEGTFKYGSPVMLMGMAEEMRVDQRCDHIERRNAEIRARREKNSPEVTQVAEAVKDAINKEKGESNETK